MKVRYEGPSPTRSVPQAGIRAVERGETIDVPAAVGRALIKQAGWSSVKRTRNEPPAGDGEQEQGEASGDDSINENKEG